MVLLFKSLVDLWRERLAWLESDSARGRTPSWRHDIERRVLTYLLRRHSDSTYAAPPSQAESLDPPSAQASNKVFLSRETRCNLGLQVDERKARLSNEPRNLPTNADLLDDLDVHLKQHGLLFDEVESRRPPSASKVDALMVILAIATVVIIFLVCFLVS